MTGGPLVVGLGSTERGDDAVGPTVARAVAALGLPGVRVVEHEDPTALLDLWSGHDPVVVVDAVSSGVQAGTLHRLETGDASPPLPGSAWSDTGRGGTHAFGVATAVELARALHRLPARLVIVGVEARLRPRRPLSEAVAAALDAAVARVLSELGRRGWPAMCLGELAEVIRVLEDGTAEVRSGSRTRSVSLLTLEERVGPGDWVVVHAGFALSRLTADEAHEAAIIRATARPPSGPGSP